MYRDDELLERYKKTWLTEKVYRLVKREKSKLEKGGRKVSMQKIINNLILEMYGENK